MNAQIGRASEAFRWFNRRAGPIAAVFLLLAAGIFVHRIALAHAGLIGTLSAKMTPEAAGRLNFVSYVGAHPWFILPYIAAVVLAVTWVQFRQLPRWSLRPTFCFLALPIVGYMSICFRVLTAQPFWMSH